MKGSDTNVRKKKMEIYSGKMFSSSRPKVLDQGKSP